MRLISRKLASQRRRYETEAVTPCAAQAAMMRSASCRSVARGFSRISPRTPPAAQLSTRSAWVPWGVATATMSRRSPASISWTVA